MRGDKKGEYSKALVGLEAPDLQCFAKKWDILYLAKDNDKLKGRLPRDHHFFVAVNAESGMREASRYGVVKTLAKPITSYDLARLDFQSQGLNIQDISNETLLTYDSFFKKGQLLC